MWRGFDKGLTHYKGFIFHKGFHDKGFIHRGFIHRTVKVSHLESSNKKEFKNIL